MRMQLRKRRNSRNKMKNFQGTKKKGRKQDGTRRGEGRKGTRIRTTQKGTA